MAKANHHPLTPDVEKEILAFVRAGGFPHIAAEAAGIPNHVFQGWLSAGSPSNKGKSKFKLFVKKLEQAMAQARLKAEIDVYNDDPKAWLRSGPGKEKLDSPGWTGIVKPILQPANQTINYFASPEFMHLLLRLRQILAPHPEALKALSEALSSQTPSPTPQLPVIIDQTP